MNKKQSIEWEEPHTHHLSVAGATLKPFSHTNASREETHAHNTAGSLAFLNLNKLVE